MEEHTKISFKIDNREQKLKETLLTMFEPSFDVQVICENLYSGDFIVEYNNECIVAIERKTVKDLIASIKDGRYRTQKQKMIEHFGVNKILYIIEGDYNIIDQIDRKSAITSIINTQLRDNIKVFNTKDLHSTCAFLYDAITRIAKQPHVYIKSQNSDSNPVNVSSKDDFISKHKVSSKEDLFFYQMTQVPGISAKTAQAFVVLFKTMKGFYEALNQVDNEQKLKLLKNIMIEDNNKKRRISSTVADNLIKFMF